jgi:hypothetical protein
MSLVVDFLSLLIYVVSLLILKTNQKKCLIKHLLWYKGDLHLFWALHWALLISCQLQLWGRGRGPEVLDTLTHQPGGFQRRAPVHWDTPAPVAIVVDHRQPLSPSDQELLLQPHARPARPQAHLLLDVAGPVEGGLQGAASGQNPSADLCIWGQTPVSLLPRSTQGYMGHTRVNVGQPTPIPDEMLHPGGPHLQHLSPDWRNGGISGKLPASQAWAVDHDIKGRLKLPQVFDSPGEQQAATCLYPGKERCPVTICSAPSGKWRSRAKTRPRSSEQTPGGLPGLHRSNSSHQPLPVLGNWGFIQLTLSENPLENQSFSFMFEDVILDVKWMTS